MIRTALSCIATILLLYAFVAVGDQSNIDQKPPHQKVTYANK